MSSKKSFSLDEAKNIGTKNGVQVFSSKFQFGDARVENCPDHLGRSLYVSAKGEVSVCPTQSATFPRLGYKGMTSSGKYLFGSLETSSFEDILSTEEFCNYQSCLKSNSVPESCRGCITAHGL